MKRLPSIKGREPTAPAVPPLFPIGDQASLCLMSIGRSINDATIVASRLTADDSGQAYSRNSPQRYRGRGVLLCYLGVLRVCPCPHSGRPLGAAVNIFGCRLRKDFRPVDCLRLTLSRNRCRVVSGVLVSIDVDAGDYATGENECQAPLICVSHAARAPAAWPLSVSPPASPVRVPQHGPAWRPTAIDQH